jgi:hypothetical protein
LPPINIICDNENLVYNPSHSSISSESKYDKVTFESSVTKRVKEVIDLNDKTHLFYHPYSDKKESSFYLEFTNPNSSKEVEGVVDQKKESISGSRIDE